LSQTFAVLESDVQSVTTCEYAPAAKSVPDVVPTLADVLVV
jgi:hypothetical protein